MLLKLKLQNIYTCELTKDLESLYGYKKVILKRKEIDKFLIVASRIIIGDIIISDGIISRICIPKASGITSKYLGEKIEIEDNRDLRVATMRLKMKTIEKFVCELTDDMENIYGFENVYLMRKSKITFCVLSNSTLIGEIVLAEGKIYAFINLPDGLESKYGGATINIENIYAQWDKSGVITGTVVEGNIFIKDKTTISGTVIIYKPKEFYGIISYPSNILVDLNKKFDGSNFVMIKGINNDTYIVYDSNVLRSSLINDDTMILLSHINAGDTRYPAFEMKHDNGTIKEIKVTNVTEYKHPDLVSYVQPLKGCRLARHLGRQRVFSKAFIEVNDNMYEHRKINGMDAYFIKGYGGCPRPTFKKIPDNCCININDEVFTGNIVNNVVSKPKLNMIEISWRMSYNTGLIDCKSNLLEDINRKFERHYDMIYYDSALIIYNTDRVHPEKKDDHISLVLNHNVNHPHIVSTDSFTLEIKNDKIFKLSEYNNLDATDDIYKIMEMYFKDIIGLEVSFQFETLDMRVSSTTSYYMHSMHIDLLDNINKELDTQFKMIFIDNKNVHFNDEYDSCVIYDNNKLELVTYYDDNKIDLISRDNNKPSTDYIVVKVDKIGCNDIIAAVRTKSDIQLTDPIYNSIIMSLKIELFNKKLSITKPEGCAVEDIRIVKNLEFTEYLIKDTYSFFRWDYLEEFNKRFGKEFHVISDHIKTVNDGCSYYYIAEFNKGTDIDKLDFTSLNDSRYLIGLVVKDNTIEKVSRISPNKFRYDSHIFNQLIVHLNSTTTGKLKVNRYTDLWDGESTAEELNKTVDMFNSLELFKDVKCWISQSKIRNRSISLYNLTDKLYRVKSEIDDNLKYVYLEDVSSGLFNGLYNVYFCKYDERFKIGAVVINGSEIKIVGFYDNSITHSEAVIEELSKCFVSFLTLDDTIFTWNNDYNKYEVVINGKTWYCKYGYETELLVFDNPNINDKDLAVGVFKVDHDYKKIVIFKRSDNVYPEYLKDLDNVIGSKIIYTTKEDIKQDEEIHDYDWLLENIYKKENLNVMFSREPWVNTGIVRTNFHSGKYIDSSKIIMCGDDTLLKIYEYEPSDEDKEAKDWYMVR